MWDQPDRPVKFPNPWGEDNTSCLVLDVDALEHNIKEMSGFASRHRLAVVPNVAGHRAIEIARLQQYHGAEEICCDTVHEVAPFVAAGFRRIQIGLPVRRAAALNALSELSSRTCLTVCVETREDIRRLAGAAHVATREISVLLRVQATSEQGTLSPSILTRQIEEIEAQENLRFRGFHVRMPLVRSLPTWLSCRQEYRRAHEWMVGIVDAVRGRGFEVEAVVRSNASYLAMHENSSIYTHIQPGKYEFLGDDGRLGDWHGPFQLRQALFCAIPLALDATREKGIIDVGCQIGEGWPDQNTVWATDRSGALRYVMVGRTDHEITVSNVGTLELFGGRLLLVPNSYQGLLKKARQFVCLRQGVLSGFWKIG